MRKEGIQVDSIGETLFNFGCYVGEVFVRNAGAAWITPTDAGASEAFEGMPLMLKLSNGILCNPIGKVFKRMENGSLDSIPWFYRYFTTEV